jgi:chromosomal replication initiation ATPase DnaA
VSKPSLTGITEQQQLQPTARPAIIRLLLEANEQLDRHYKLRSLGYSFEKVGHRVAALYDLPFDEICQKGRRQVQVEARDLLCYWAVRELKMSCTEVATRLGMSQPGVGYAVDRGKKVAEKNKYQLVD